MNKINKIGRMIGLMCCLCFGWLVSANAQPGTSHYYYSPNANPNYVMVTVGNGFLMINFNPSQIPARLNMVKRDGANFTYQGNGLVAIMAVNMSMMTVGNGRGNAATYQYCGPAGAMSLPSSTMVPQQMPRTEGPRTYKCQFCNGTGRIAKNDHVPQYGSSSYSIEVKCNECGFVYNSTFTNHYHLDCGHCGGTGQIVR